MEFNYHFDDTSPYFGLFSVIFILFFAVFIGVLIFAIVRAVRQWSKNNRSPKLTVEAIIVGKRIDVTHHHHRNHGPVFVSSSTSYYVTFQVESGDRIELPVSGIQYGILSEGDSGKLTFQGTRYIDFSREK